jgi:hypothetical protein
MGCLGVALKKYSDQNGFKDCHKIGIVLPVSLRAPPKSIDDIKLQNMLGLGSMAYPVSNDIKETIQKGKSALHQRFKPSLMYGSQKLQLLLKYSPEFLGRYMVQQVSIGSDLVVSNVPGPKKETTFCGHRISKLFPFTPHLSMIGLSILGMTYSGKFQFSVYQDTGVKMDAKVLLNMIEAEIDQLI